MKRGQFLQQRNCEMEQKKNERRRGEELGKDKAKASFSFPELRFFWSASGMYADQKDRSSKK